MDIKEIIKASIEISKENNHRRDNPYIITTTKDYAIVSDWCDKHPDIAKLFNGCILTESFIRNIK